jgi:hypothetical protein
VAPIPLGGVRDDLLLGEVPGQRLDLALVRREVEQHPAASIVVAGLRSGTADLTMPWSWYSDPRTLPHEQERFFRRALGSSQFGPTKGEAGPVEGQFHWLWPVTKLYTLPGPQNLVAGPFVPLDPTRSRTNRRLVQLLLRRGRLRRGSRGADRLRRPGRRRGRRMVESVQQGVASGLLDCGRLLPESERLLAHFQELVRRTLA